MNRLEGWSTDNGWFAVSCILAMLLIYAYRDLHDANKRTKDLHDIAQNLNEQLQELKRRTKDEHEV